MACIQRATAAITAKRMCRSMVYGNVRVCVCGCALATGQTGDNRDTNLASCSVVSSSSPMIQKDPVINNTLLRQSSARRTYVSVLTRSSPATHMRYVVRKATLELYQVELVTNRRISLDSLLEHTHIRTPLQASGVFKRLKWNQGHS
jgi:hypothetical protein